MYNLTQENNSTGYNFTEPILPEIPLIFYEEYSNKYILWMSPLLILTIWVNIYILFNVILYFAKMYNDCVEKKHATVCTGEFKCKKGCENCVGNIFLETYV